MKKIFIVAFVTLFCLLSYSQSYFKKGQIIKDNEQVVECYINSQDWYYSPTKISYKLNQDDGNTIEADVNSIKSFEIYDQEKYVRFQLKIDISSEKTQNLSTVREPDYIDKIFFAQEIVTGDLSLFKYVTNDYTRFIIQNAQGEAEQLIYKQYLPVSTESTFNNDYKKQIPRFLNCKSLDLRLLQTLKFNQEELSKIIIENNVCVDPNYSQKVRKISKGDVNLNINVRGNYTTLNMNQNDRFIFEFEPKFTVGFGIELEYVFPISNNKWAAFVEPSYSQFSSTSTLQINNYTGSNSILNVDEVEISYSSLDVTIGVRHYFVSSGNNKIFINLNQITNIPMGDSFLRRKLATGYKIRDVNFRNFSLGVGSKIHNKFIAELRYNRFSNKINSSAVNTQNNNVFMLILGYNLY